MTHNDVSTLKSSFQSQNIYLSRNESMRAYGYKQNWPKTYLIYLAYTLTFGILRLLFYWYPHLQLYATHINCSLAEATKILVVNDYRDKCRTYFVKNVVILSTKNWRANQLFRLHNIQEIDLLDRLGDEYLQTDLENGAMIKSPEYRVFWCKNQCYVWDAGKNEFSKLTSLQKSTCCSDLGTSYEGLAKEEQILRRIVHGNNVIYVPVKSLGTLIAQAALNPFCAFQLFSFATWLCDDYYFYTIMLLLVCMYNVVSSALQTRKNQTILHDTMTSKTMVHVMRNNRVFENISSVELVPGDVIKLPRGKGTIICDAVLLDGTCVIDEAELTGESIPVVKSPLPCQEIPYNSKLHSYNTLFCGTTVIQSRNDNEKSVLAKVIKTGMQTRKGTLVTSILYPPPTDLKFKRDLRKILNLLCLIGLLETIYVGYALSRIEIYRQQVQFIVIHAMSAITIVVPASLPIVLMAVASRARTRLRNKKIYCNDTQAINLAGSIDCVCFDKTGTLTENGLSIMGIISSTHRMLGYLEKTPNKVKSHPIFQGMLVCHSLVHIDGELAGDVLDLGIFESTGWKLLEPTKRQGKAITSVESPDGNEQIHVVKQYQFSSDLQRMSVIVQSPNSNRLKVYVKGSPEMILGMSTLESCPYDALAVLQSYTEQGYRVIAFGCSILDDDCEHKLDNLPREEIEKDLEFLGFVVFENKLKSATKNVIEELRDCNMRIVMITGDNVQTAASVAKQCGIISQNERVIGISVEKSISHPTKLIFEMDNCNDVDAKLGRCKFVITGDTWQYFCQNDADMLTKICKRGAVFARMTSNQKQQLIIQLIESGLNVAMCGDGANDCEALKAAHVGIALTQTESSVASPFLSLTPDISCMTTLIREGRAALVTSFGTFQFMIVGAIVGSISILTLNWIGSSPTNWQFVYMDFFLILLFSLLFGNTETYEGKLVAEPPISSLFSLRPIMSMSLHIMVHAIFQLSVFWAVQHQNWYTPFVKNDRVDYGCYENYSVVSISYFQYIIMAVSFSLGEPYRKPLYTNYSLVISLSIGALASVYMTLCPAQWIVDLFEMKIPPVMGWRYMIICLAFLNCVVCLWIDEMVLKKLLDRMLRMKDEVKQAHLNVQAESKRKNKLANIGKVMSLDSNMLRNEMPTVRRSFAGSPSTTFFKNRAFVNDV